VCCKKCATIIDRRRIRPAKKIPNHLRNLSLRVDNDEEGLTSKPHVRITSDALRPERSNFLLLLRNKFSTLLIMIIRSSSSAILFALAVSFTLAPALLSRAQMSAPADASSSNAAPAAPAAPTAPETAAPADTNAPTSTAPEERPATYTMQQGDSLDSIAKKFDTSIHALAKLNHIPKSMYRKLRAGKVLQIPPAHTDSSSK
jgi:LysM repeat protein